MIFGHTRGKDAEQAQLAIEHFERDDCVLISFGEGYWGEDDGRYYHGEETRTPIKCVVEPISSQKDRELIMAEEGEHVEAHIVVWYQGELQTSDSKGSNDNKGFSDVIEYRGEKWKVIRAQRRTEGAFFTRAICALWEDAEGELNATGGSIA